MAPTTDRDGERAGVVVETTASIEISAGLAALLALRVTPLEETGQHVRAVSLSVGGWDLAVDGTDRPVRAVTDGSPTLITVSSTVELGIPVPGSDSPTTDADDSTLPFEEFVSYLTASRYCPADRLVGFAQAEFGSPESSGGHDTIDRVADFVNSRLAYRFGSSTHTTDAIDTLASGDGVCRDFAHLTITLLRAVGVPARYVAAYAPGLDPQDFHAIVEAHDGDRWRAVDATGLCDPTFAVRISRGRDSADTAFLSIYSGSVQIAPPVVSAEISSGRPQA